MLNLKNVINKIILQIMYFKFFLYEITWFLSKNKHKILLAKLYAIGKFSKGLYVQITCINSKQLTSSRSMCLARELVAQNYICLIIALNTSKASKSQFREIEPNIFITCLADIIFDLKGVIISINPATSLYSFEDLKQIKSNQNKIIYEYTEEPRSTDYKELIQNNIVDFVICTTQPLAQKLQYYFYVDKVLYSPNPSNSNVATWEHIVYALVRCIELLIPVSSNLKPLPL